MADITTKLPDEFRENLSIKQQKAIVMLLEGDKKANICSALDINQSTLWRWDNKDEDFQEAYNALKEEQIRPELERLMLNTEKAVDTLVSELKAHNMDAATYVIDRYTDIINAIGGDDESKMVAHGQEEKHLLKVFRRQRGDQMFKYILHLISERDSDEVVELIQEELNMVEGEAIERGDDED